MKVKINGVKYDCVTYLGKCDGYYIKGNLVSTDTPLKVTHQFTMDDGSVIGVKKSKLPIYIVAGVSIILLISILTYFITKNISKPLSENVTIDDGTEEVTKGDTSIFGVDDEIVLKFNRYVPYTNGKLELNLVNGDDKVTVALESDIYTMDDITLKPNEQLDSIEAKVKGKETLSQAKLIVTLPNKTISYDIVIERFQDESTTDESFKEEEVIVE